MRKKTVDNLSIIIFDYVMWYLIYLLPLIAFLFVCKDNVSLSEVMTSFGFALTNDNIILTSFINLFGSSGVFPTFVNNGLLQYFSYFVMCLVIHLAVDTLAFIPRLAHKFIDKLGE